MAMYCRVFRVTVAELADKAVLVMMDKKEHVVTQVDLARKATLVLTDSPDLLALVVLQVEQETVEQMAEMVLLDNKYVKFANVLMFLFGGLLTGVHWVFRSLL